MIIDRRAGWSFAGDWTAGSTHRFYDLQNAGLLGRIGDTILWTTPQGDAQGDITATGWENTPLPTYWADVVVTEAP